MYYDYDDDTLLGKLNRKFGRYGIKNSMMILIIGLAIVNRYTDNDEGGGMLI